MTTLPLHNDSLAHPTYRADIDGLRALAILSVVGFHAFPQWLQAGFVGVDIFFVISGYLISTIIWQNLAQGTFSFADFYARRVKRIFPALLLVMLASLVFGWFTLLADEYKQLGKHLAAGAGFVANFALLGEAGYFDNAVETKPLLHLWSLAIEEQFYLLWPLALWLAWKAKVPVLIFTLGAAAVSLYLNITQISTAPVATFFSPQTRVWELLAGAALAWWHLQGRPTHRWLAQAFALLGVCVLAYGFWVIHKGIRYPGKSAMIPVLGTVLLIAAGPQAWVNRVLLSHRLALWFGLISYPLYLWHWPLLSFARIVEGEEPAAPVRLGLVLLAVGLAWLTYRWVERPVRHGRLAPSGKRVPALLVVAMIGVGAGGYATWVHDGVVQRFKLLAPAYQEQIVRIANAWQFREYPQPIGMSVDAKTAFKQVGSNASEKVLFLGDSHMEQYWNTVGELYQRAGDAQAHKPAVLFTDLALVFPPVLPPALLDDRSIRTVVLSYYWAYRYRSDKVNQAVRCCGFAKGRTVGADTLPLFDAAQMDAIDQQWLALVQTLQARGKTVHLVLDNPFGQELDPHSMLSRSWRGLTIEPATELTRTAALERTEPVRSRLLRIARATGVRVIDPFDTLCGPQVCPAFSAEGELMYKDYDHLSLFASRHKVAYLDGVFN